MRNNIASRGGDELPRAAVGFSLKAAALFLGENHEC